jgi:hypothetical protein
MDLPVYELGDVALTPLVEGWVGVAYLEKLIGVSVLRVGYAVAQLVETLRCKPKGCGFESRWSHWNFSVI